MNWNDYEAIWKRQELPVGTAADLTEIKQSFYSKSRKMERLFLFRDVAEGSTGVLVSIGMAFAWWREGRIAWPIAFSIVLTLGVTLVFFRERLRARRLRLGSNAPILAKVEADIAELKHQHQLFSNIGIWYYAPVILAIVIGFIALSRRRNASMPPGLIWELLKDPYASPLIVAMLVTFILGTFLAWRASRDNLKKQVEPRIAELEKLRADLLS